MGLFDFLKNKPQPDPGATKAPADATPQPEAPKEKTGPRYKGANFVAPPAAPAPLPGPPPLPATPFQPENVLEELLLLAPHDENARPAFYQALLQENVLLVLAPHEGLTPGETQLEEGQQIQLQVLQDGKLPVFTSEARLRDGGHDHGPVSWVRLPGHAYFSMVQGQDCVLNPFSPAGKLLPKDEIDALLAGQLTQPPAGGLPPDAQVTLSQPDTLPTGLADALAAFGAAQPTIQAIYLAQMQLANDPTQPARLLLGFATADPDPAFLQELAPVLQGRTGNFQFVDMMLVDLASDEGVNPYFRRDEVTPIYRW